MERKEQKDQQFKAKLFEKDVRDFVFTLGSFGVIGEVLDENLAVSVKESKIVSWDSAKLIK